MAIFSDMVEKCIEVFMDDFSVFGPSFEGCLSNLERVLQRCEKSNLVLNWEKCHFIDYVSKWVEAVAASHNDAKTVVKFLKKNIFSRFGVPRILISDGGTHFCNNQL